MLDTILNVLLIIAATCWIVLCFVAYGAIRLWKRNNRNQLMQQAVAIGVARKRGG